MSINSIDAHFCFPSESKIELDFFLAKVVLVGECWCFLKYDFLLNGTRFFIVKRFHVLNAISESVLKTRCPFSYYKSNSLFYLTINLSYNTAPFIVITLTTKIPFSMLLNWTNDSLKLSEFKTIFPEISTI